MNPWNRELWLLAGFLLPALLIGLLTGQLAWSLVAALAAYVIWQGLRWHRLYRWMHTGPRREPPEMSGLPGDFAYQVSRLARQEKKRKKKLGKVLGHFYDSLAAMPDAVVTLDNEFRVEWFNQAAAELLGLKKIDRNRRITNLLRDPRFGQCLLEGGLKSRSCELTSPHDERVTLNVRLVPFGKNQYLLLARDVTRLQRLEQMRRDFVANVSHELRTPLTVLNGYLETLASLPADDPRIAPELRPSLERMNGQVQRMRSLITDLLQLSRLESNPEAEEECVNVTALVAAVGEETEQLAQDKEQQVEVEIRDESCLLGSTQELHSAFANLASNAVRYTPEGGHIAIRWYIDEHGGHFEVEDTGIGIAPHHLNRLTERFYRVDSDRSRENGGTGLGLAIVKHVLQRHDGSLHITSQPGQGSTFRCDFPTARLTRPPVEPLRERAVTKGS